MLRIPLRAFGDQAIVTSASPGSPFRGSGGSSRRLSRSKRSAGIVVYCKWLFYNKLRQNNWPW